jgi:hypothetical protein
MVDAIDLNITANFYVAKLHCYPGALNRDRTGVSWVKANRPDR